MQFRARKIKSAVFSDRINDVSYGSAASNRFCGVCRNACVYVMIFDLRDSLSRNAKFSPEA
jgi:hypothetical protein